MAQIRLPNCTSLKHVGNARCCHVLLRINEALPDLILGFGGYPHFLISAFTSAITSPGNLFSQQWVLCWKLSLADTSELLCTAASLTIVFLASRAAKCLGKTDCPLVRCLQVLKYFTFLLFSYRWHTTCVCVGGYGFHSEYRASHILSQTFYHWVVPPTQVLTLNYLTYFRKHLSALERRAVILLLLNSGAMGRFRGEEKLEEGYKGGSGEWNWKGESNIILI